MMATVWSVLKLRLNLHITSHHITSHDITKLLRYKTLPPLLLTESLQTARVHEDERNPRAAFICLYHMDSVPSDSSL